MLDPRAELANNHVEQFDAFRSTNDRYGTWGPWNLDAGVRKSTENYEYRSNTWDDDEGVQLRPLNAEDDQSGVHSPPLWTSSPPRSPVHLRYHHVINYRSLSPTSRTQAIARGQRELMEMVKNMPESSYELSLKDLVEQPRLETQEECLLQDKNNGGHHQQVVAHQRVNIKRQESKKNEKKSNMSRSASMDNRGLFLKMVFPISLKSRKKKNVNSPSSTCAKVSPKPDQVSDRTSKSVDKDWWKKRFSASSESSDSSGRSSSNNCGSTGSSGSSSSCSNSSIRRNSGFFSSCLPCFHFTKGKSAE